MTGRPKVLCVDDERNVLDGLALYLGRKTELLTATSGAEGLEVIRKNPGIDIIMSDMRMPGMTGAAFLAESRRDAPDAVRLLLTGYADVSSATAAVNEGRIFRFLTKPCPPPIVMTAMEAAFEQRQLITAEKVLLEQTLRGVVRMLTDLLALTNPAAAGRATRLSQLATELATAMGMEKKWELEVAALLLPLGNVCLPTETSEKVYYGQPLSVAEETMVARVPATTEQLLAHVPRMEGVREIITQARTPVPRSTERATDPRGPAIKQAVQVLSVAMDFDLLETQGATAAFALDTMRGRADRYDARVLQALTALRGGTAAAHDDVRELPINSLRPGMVLAEDLKLTSGGLLVVRGYQITPSFLARVRNYPAGAIRDPVRVIVGGKE